MKTMKNVTLYLCEFCKKKYLHKGWCKYHEAKCSNNPINFMKCIDCAFAEKKTMYYIKWVACPMHGVREEEAKIKASFCGAKKIWVYPRLVSYPILQEDINEEVRNEPMPNECSLYKNAYFYNKKRKVNKKATKACRI